MSAVTQLRPAFAKATKRQSYGRLALIGPSGSGKTYSALRIASAMGKRVAVIDTERGSASKYADVFGFDVLELESHAPARYVEALRLAEAEGYEVVIVDSLSHAWAGKDGALEQVDRAAKRSQSGNTFMAWRDVTPQHNALVDALVQLRAHLIVTMRAKTEYVFEEDGRGKKVPKKVGLAPIQRDGLEYEFDVVGEVNLAHDLVVSKSRCPAMADQIYPMPGEDVAAVFLGWLRSGEAAPAAPEPTEESRRKREEIEADIVLLADENTRGTARGYLAEAGHDVAKLKKLGDWIAKRLPKAEPAPTVEREPGAMTHDARGR